MNEAEFRKSLEEFEGYRTHMYLDSRGYVTIGVGIMFPSAGAAKSSGIKFTNRETGAVATADEIEADYNAVKQKKPAKLVGDEAALKKALDARLKTAEADCKAFYKDYAKLPSSVQYALLDMAFNLGRGNLMKYKNFKAALEKSDWKTAAKESKRNGIQASRNKAASDWILAAK
jgi:GH24 family phage-related lysozyme (muramidase)